MNPPSDFIMPQKVGKAELYRIFNDPGFRQDIIRRTNQRVDVYCEPACADYNQPPGTMSYIYDWMEYDHQQGRMNLLATVHMFKLPDGSIGASGQPDPVVLIVDGAILTDP